VLRTQQEQDQALAAVERRWQERLHEREKTFVETQQLQVAEAERVAGLVEELLPPLHRPQQHCQAGLEEVAACYSANPGRPLDCAATVARYRECVARATKGFDREDQDVCTIL